MFGSSTEDIQVNIAERLFSYYRIVRTRSDDLGSGVITIGNYTFEYEGAATCSSLSQFLVVSIRNDCGIGADIANTMGMDVTKIQDKYYYPFVV